MEVTRRTQPANKEGKGSHDEHFVVVGGSLGCNHGILSHVVIMTILNTSNLFKVLGMTIFLFRWSVWK